MTKSITINEVEEVTNDFLLLHWNIDKLNNIAIPKHWEAYNLKGVVPFGDRQGCYALIKNEKVVYIGLGASRGGGLYQEHGIGARLNSHVLNWDRSTPSDITNRVYKPRTKWSGLSKIYTFGFPHGYGYLACSLEAYLISKLEPEENVIKTSIKSF